MAFCLRVHFNGQTFHTVCDAIFVQHRQPFSLSYLFLHLFEGAEENQKGKKNIQSHGLDLNPGTFKIRSKKANHSVATSGGSRWK
jgi:hypothetical protein